MRTKTKSIQYVDYRSMIEKALIVINIIIYAFNIYSIF